MNTSMTFAVIDVETANADRSTICQVGIVRVADGEIADEWETLVNPEAWFDDRNVEVHAITESDVARSPTIPDLESELRERLQGVVISHTSFDRVAVERAMSRYGLEAIPAIWLDSAAIARRAWPERFGARGWGLENVARFLGIDFTHHDALEDAKAAAQIVIAACEWTELDIDGRLGQIKKPINP